MENAFISSLERYSEIDWRETLESLAGDIHEVDRTATQIWFRFYPLSLHRYLSNAAKLEEAKQGVAMQGDFGLDGSIDTSHSFLFGHRYWETVKSVIEDETASFAKMDVKLSDVIRQLAAKVAKVARADGSLVTGITAVGLMTLVQVGLDKFKASSGETSKSSGRMSKSADSVVAARKKDDSQGMLGFLKTVDKKFSVIHDEAKGERFEIMNDQEIASASANDRSQNWQEKDPRCWEGPVPVECTSASCGTCWVGVIAGKEKLSEVARRESRAVKVFGYNDTEDPKPVIRLACQAKAYGNVTIVIPPWNAVFGKKVYGNVDELELEPVTTSAKKLRETISSAAGSGE